VDKEVIENKVDKEFDNERASLWREELLAELIVIYHILELFNVGKFIKNIQNLSKACADSRRERVPQLCAFSSA
jgi:isochorismate hydrolase